MFAVDNTTFIFPKVSKPISYVSQSVCHFSTLTESFKPIITSHNPPYRKRWRLVHLPMILANENPKNAHKKVLKSYKNFKSRIHNVVSTGTNFAKKHGFLCVICVRYCGKM